MENNSNEFVTKIGDWVLVKNNQFIAFNKPVALPVQPDKTKEKSLLELAEIYCKSKIYLTHRIDRPASGIVLFAKTNKALTTINEQLHKHKVKKTYLAVVKDLPNQPEGKITHYLRKNGKTNKTQVFNEPVKEGEEAILSYKILGNSDNYHLLEIDLLTGRHHQIRAQLAAIGAPIKGDVKYGARRANKDRSIHLHSWKMSFQHPITQEIVEITADLPNDPVWNAFFQDKK